MDSARQFIMRIVNPRLFMSFSMSSPTGPRVRLRITCLRLFLLRVNMRDLPRMTSGNEESRKNGTRSPTRGPVSEDMQKLIFSCMAFYDVVSTIHQSLASGRTPWGSGCGRAPKRWRLGPLDWTLRAGALEGRRGAAITSGMCPTATATAAHAGQGIPLVHYSAQPQPLSSVRCFVSRL